MAKSSVSKASGPSRIRLVVFEAEIADGGDLNQITLAIQNALRAPIPTVAKRIAAPTAQANGTAGAVQTADIGADDNQVIEDEIEATESAPTAPKPKLPRRVGPKPNVIDIDVTSDPPVSSIPDRKSNHGRYLAIAAWLHDHRGITTITRDHIYTCYRHRSWPTDIPDFSQPLRELKHLQLFTSSEKGKFEVNQLGLAKAADASSD